MWCCELKVIIHAFWEVGGARRWYLSVEVALCTPTSALEPLSIIPTSNETKQMHSFSLLLLERKPACDVFSAVWDELLFKDVNALRTTLYLYPSETEGGWSQKEFLGHWEKKGKIILCFIFKNYTWLIFIVYKGWSIILVCIWGKEL